MDIILRKNSGEGGLMPLYRPLTTFDVWDTLSRELWDSWRPFDFGDSLVPDTDIYEEKGELVMKTELPGIDKKDVEITLEGDTLTIKALKKEELKEDATHHARERYYGQYFRSITLPYPVKEEKITAELDNGVLELRLPKGEQAKAHRIEVKGQLPEGETGKPEKKPKQKKS
jgi:HSP20 family protein